MAPNLSHKINGRFQGDLVQSLNDEVILANIEIEKLNDLLVKVSFDLEGERVVFRAMLSESGSDVYMTVQQRVTRGYILDGKSGFIYGKANTHGGLLTNVNSLFFNIKMGFFTGKSIEVYFFGKAVTPKTTPKKETQEIRQPV